MRVVASAVISLNRHSRRPGCAPLNGRPPAPFRHCPRDQRTWLSASPRARSGPGSPLPPAGGCAVPAYEARHDATGCACQSGSDPAQPLFWSAWPRLQIAAYSASPVAAPAPGR